MKLEFVNPYDAVSRPQLDDLLNGGLGIQGVETTANFTTITVEHKDLTESNIKQIQILLDSYVFDPMYGAIPPVKTLEQRLTDLETDVATLKVTRVGVVLGN